MTDADVAGIAKGLTKAQRAIVAGECRDIGNPAVWYLVWPDHSSLRGAKTLAILTRLGIVERTRFGPTSLTLAGLAARALLLSSDKAPCPLPDNERD
jgi:hypothetical protein